MLKCKKKKKKLKFNGHRAELRPKILTDNPGQSICNKIEKSSQIKMNKRRSIASRTCFLNCS